MIRKSLIDECNPDGKIADDVFFKAICSQCANPRCDRSRYNDQATKRKLEKREKLQAFVDPSTIPVSPLSEFPPELASPIVDQSTKNLGEQDLEIKIPSENNIAGAKPVDPWVAPSLENIHKEYSTPEEDPWSSGYTGGLNLRVKSKAVIRMPK